MKKSVIALLLSGQAAAHSGAGTPDALFHVHGVEYVGAGLVVLAVALAMPLLRRLWQHWFRT
ncbi:MAG: hypothetical protein ACPG43_04605 [Alcanivoracaceae bacterium]